MVIQIVALENSIVRTNSMIWIVNSFKSIHCATNFTARKIWIIFKFRFQRKDEYYILEWYIYLPWYLVWSNTFSIIGAIRNKVLLFVSKQTIQVNNINNAVWVDFKNLPKLPKMLHYAGIDLPFLALDII